MITKAVKYVSIAGLLATALLWQYTSITQAPLQLLVSGSALLVGFQAVRARKYVWAVGFYGVTLLFNPFVTVMNFSGWLALFVILATTAPFAVSLTALPCQPLPSIPSITDRIPGSESL